MPVCMYESESDRDSLPVLKYIMEKGNTTTYQWRTGEKPEVIEEAKIFGIQGFCKVHATASLCFFSCLLWGMIGYFEINIEVS